MQAKVGHQALGAVAETVAVAAAYMAVSIAAVSLLDVSHLFPETWSSEERATGGGFVIGAVIQVLLVLIGAYLIGLSDLRRAIAASVARSTSKAWTIAAIATAIHIGTAIVAILPDPRQVWQPSALNLVLSIVPAADGWSQEVLFRGYVLFRLARAGLPAVAQVLLSGTLFAAIHVGYAGETAWTALSPLVGTFMLGCFYAWAVKSGRDSLKPVICCHVLIILMLQPWLALAR